MLSRPCIGIIWNFIFVWPITIKPMQIKPLCAFFFCQYVTTRLMNPKIYCFMRTRIFHSIIMRFQNRLDFSPKIKGLNFKTLMELELFIRSIKFKRALIKFYWKLKKIFIFQLKQFSWIFSSMFSTKLYDLIINSFVTKYGPWNIFPKLSEYR